MSDPVRPHRRPPTRLPPFLGFSRQEHWSGLPFPLQCMKVKSESEVAQSCPTLSDPMGCSLPGSSIHGIFQARVLESGAITFSTDPLSFTQKLQGCWLSQLLWLWACLLFKAAPELRRWEWGEAKMKHHTTCGQFLGRFSCFPWIILLRLLWIKFNVVYF